MSRDPSSGGAAGMDVGADCAAAAGGPEGTGAAARFATQRGRTTKTPTVASASTPMPSATSGPVEDRPRGRGTETPEPAEEPARGGGWRATS